MRLAMCGGLLALVCGLAACSSSAGTPAPGGASSSGSGSSSSGARAVLATDAQNGHSVSAHVGQVVRVTLGSTYWHFLPLVGSVLGAQGTPSFAPNGSCVPGGGCGTVTQTYRALRAGTARVAAARTTCGEVVRCAPNQRSFTLSVVVSG